MAPRVDFKSDKTGKRKCKTRKYERERERGARAATKEHRSVGGRGKGLSDSEGRGRGGGETILSLPPVYRLSESARLCQVYDYQKLVSVFRCLR